MGSGCSSKKQKRVRTPPPVRVLDSDPPPKRPQQSAPASAVATAQSASQSDQVPFRWKKGALLGSGAYGKVYECLNLDTGEIHVVKEIQLGTDPTQVQKEISGLKREIMTLKTLNHKNVVKYLHTEVSPDKKGVQIIMEYVSGGSIKSLLDKFGVFEEAMAARYVKQILDGLDYLHSNGIIHRDIKCANILVDQSGGVKLTDFGAAKRISQSGEDFAESKSLTGSPYWMAPEVVKRSGHSYPSDIWSLGCVLIEMLTGNPPWSDVSQQAVTVLRLLSETTRPPTFPSNISLKCKSFLYRCLRLNPENRATAQELLRHPFITGDELSIDHKELLEAEEKEAEPEQPWIIDPVEAADPYEAVYDLDDIPVTRSKPTRDFESKPTRESKVSVETRHIIEGDFPMSDSLELVFEKKTIIENRGPAIPGKKNRILIREEEEIIPQDRLRFNPEDLIAQTRIAERARRVEEQRRKDAEMAKRARLQAWQAELDSHRMDF